MGLWRWLDLSRASGGGHGSERQEKGREALPHHGYFLICFWVIFSYFSFILIASQVQLARNFMFKECRCEISRTLLSKFNVYK